MAKRKQKPAKRKIRKKAAKSIQKRRVSTWLPVLLISLGIVLVSAWAVHRFNYAKSIQLPDSILALYQKEDVSRRLPVFIDIDGIGRLPIDQSGKVNGVWTIANDAANHVAQSALPGSAGHIIIYGHNTAKVFGRLVERKAGDYIGITTADGKFHQYRIYEVNTVSPDRIDLLRPTTSETLTVYTCTGFLDSKRFVVRAIPVTSH